MGHISEVWDIWGENKRDFKEDILVAGREWRQSARRDRS